MLSFPIFFLANSRSVWWYWEQCDSAAKVIVVILVICSCASLSIIVKKFFELLAWRSRNFVFEAQVHRSKKLSELVVSPRTPLASPYEQVFSAASNALAQHRGKIRNDDDIRVCMGHVENAIQRMIGRVTAVYEKGMIPLSAFVSGGPFLGLLGTVWGVMVTFGALTEKATISALAPGVSGALVATTFGLILAIPASFAYNWLLGRTRQMATELDNFASSVADQLETELLESLREKQHAAEAREPAPVASSGNPFLRDESGENSGARPSWN